MRRFAALYAALDASTSTEAKVAALVQYLAEAPPADAAWGVYFLAGGKPRQTVPTALLRAEATALAGIPDWLFEASYQAVGDLAETIAQILPPPRQTSDLGLADWLTQRLLPLRGQPPEVQTAALRAWWDELPAEQRFLLVKLIGGGFRVGVSKLLVQRALARHAGLDAKLVAQRMMGWTDGRQPPTAARLAALLAPAGADGGADAQDDGQPYPFFLAHALDDAPPAQLAARLGPVADWQAEWKYDGIRAQLVRRGGRLWIWSRGEELITERFPEVVAQADGLPDGTVLDGELLAWGADDRPAPFQALQQRIQRKTLPRKLLAAVPVRFIAYDLLELAGQDCRPQPLQQRRSALQALLDGQPLALSPEVQADDWTTLATLRQQSRDRGVEGLMLKHRQSAYGSGRTKADGLWWKWKIAPHTVDAVLVYAQAGHGRRAGLYTDYTFAVWSRPPADAAEADAVVQAIAARLPAQPGALQLLTFTKAYSGLSDAEFKQVDAVIRASTLEKFGPVRSLKPGLVFELAFEGIARSPRHKSGIALRFPRMLRIRHDKPLWQADSLQTLEALVPVVAG
ncbi:ATP-dependent DNA ligase [Pseudaquabacterium pictum]|uniref:DNA ligase (ATP) n=1 Tax=Pseudaquabacterium pictum TaxID=2315236 RepID=A0A480AZB5_9BURK|nr:ATP-dependent DNA ligase [Rubrivivax pictus]GCL65075.1 ATP-dependent DNA ligase [Rubrivivax pictus]